MGFAVSRGPQLGAHPSPRPGLTQGTASREPPWTGCLPQQEARPWPWALDAQEKHAQLTGSLPGLPHPQA